MTDAQSQALADVLLSGPVGVAVLCLAGIYLTLWRAQDKKMRLTLLHVFLAGFGISVGTWVLDIVLMRAGEFYNCF